MHENCNKHGDDGMTKKIKQYIDSKIVELARKELQIDDKRRKEYAVIQGQKDVLLALSDEFFPEGKMLESVSE